MKKMKFKFISRFLFASYLIAILIFSVGCRSIGGAEEFNLSPLFSYYSKDKLKEYYLANPAYSQIAETSNNTKISLKSEDLILPKQKSEPSQLYKIPIPKAPDELIKKVELLYPLFEYQQKAGGREEYGLRPLFYFTKDLSKNITDVDLLYPLGKYYSSPTETIFRLLPIVYYSEMTGPDGRKEIDSFLFPLIFFGNEVFPSAPHLVNPLMRRDRNKDGKLSYYELGGKKSEFDLLDLNEDEYITREEAKEALSKPRTLSYFAVFPFGGLLRDFLTKEWMEFYLFPLFYHACDKGYETWYMPWPIIHWGSGAGHDSFAIWPLYAGETKRFLIEDKDGNIIEGPKEYERHTILWPLIQWQKNWDLKKVSKKGEPPKYEHKVYSENVFVFPFFGHRKTPRREVLTFLWPFFTIETKKDTDFIAIDAPWPFFRYAEGIGHYELRIFPLFYQFRKIDEKGSEHSGYRILWPLIWLDTRKDVTQESQSVNIAGIFWHNRRTKLDIHTGKPKSSETYTKLWPLFGHHSGHDGSVLFEILSLLPFDNVPKWEYTWAWFWRIFYYESKPSEGITRFNFLGPIIRYESTPRGNSFDFFPIFQYRDSKDASGVEREMSWDFLYGLFGGGRDEEGAYFRLFWFIKIR